VRREKGGGRIGDSSEETIPNGEGEEAEKGEERRFF
jgi:hypothetical protein